MAIRLLEGPRLFPVALQHTVIAIIRQVQLHLMCCRSLAVYKLGWWRVHDYLFPAHKVGIATLRMRDQDAGSKITLLPARRLSQLKVSYK